MVSSVEKQVSLKPVTQESIVESANREFIPVIRDTRKAVNSILLSACQAQIAVDIRQSGSRPATTDTSYTACDTEHSTLDYRLIYFDASQYPEDQDGALVRNIYLEYSVMHVLSTGTSAEFVLYNSTDAEVVSGTEYSTLVPDTLERALLGPLTVGSDSGNLKNELKTYTVQGKRTGGTAADLAVCFSARFLIRYE